MSLADESEAWAHMRAGRFAEAETAIRMSIGRVGKNDHRTLCELFGLLGTILNSREQHDDATEALREALKHALQIGEGASEVSTYRYFLANQLLNFGDPEQALAAIHVVPPGIGHVQYLLHVTAAKALWSLGRQDEARRAATEALSAAPTDKERAELVSELGEIRSSDQ